MEYNIATYYEQRRKKKKRNKIKVSFGIIAIFGIILFGRQQILKSNSSYINDSNINQEKNIDNEEIISVIIDNPKENIIENNVNDKTNNENQLDNNLIYSQGINSRYYIYR